ncbi:MAG: hypothetical protein KF878_05140 [Planctomycetes bacterium]|nr:hypothetical protein [Planctomycetota bacterium]
MVKRAAIPEQAHCLVVAWCGATLLPPSLAVGLERERRTWRAESDDRVWAASEFENFETPALTLDDPDLLRRCARLRQLLNRAENASRALVALYREVAVELNSRDWSDVLPVTSDFVVFPSDVELVGLAGHLRAVLGKDRLAALVSAMGCSPPA